MSRWLIVVTLLASSHAAFADDNADAKAKYAAGDYTGAAEAFIKAYKTDPDPAYLFNIAQSYRLADNCVEAAKYYQQFLDKIPNPPNLDAVKGWKADADKCAKERTPVVIPPKDPPPKDPPPKDPPRPPPPSRPSIVPGVAAIGVGAVLGVVGGVEQYQRHKLAKDYDAFVKAHCPPCDGADLNRKFDDPAHTKLIITISAYSAGAVAVGLGAWLLVRRNTTEHPIAVAPTKGGAMVSTGLSF